MDWYFIVDGDIHGEQLVPGGPLSVRAGRADMPSRIIDVHAETPIEFVVCTGDLTSNGLTDTAGLRWLWPSRGRDQLRAFRTLYEQPLEAAGIPVWLQPGNHDMSTPAPTCWKGVPRYIARKHGATGSAWSGGRWRTTRHGVVFLSLGVDPGRNLDWLRRHISDEPTIIWYHYNTDPGERWADFWSDADRDAFYTIIAGRNILAILNGHSHSTRLGLWHDIPVIRGSGNQIARVRMTDDRITGVDWIYRDGTVRDAVEHWNHMPRRLDYDERNHNEHTIMPIFGPDD